MKGLFLVSKHISILDSARTVAVYTATAASLLAVYAVPAIYFFPFASSETTFCASLFSRIGIVFFTVSLSTLFLSAPIAVPLPYTFIISPIFFRKREYELLFRPLSLLSF